VSGGIDTKLTANRCENFAGRTRKHVDWNWVAIFEEKPYSSTDFSGCDIKFR
jgi:hypothetical protein